MSKNEKNGDLEVRNSFLVIILRWTNEFRITTLQF